MNSHSKRILTTFSLFSFMALLPMSCGLFCGNDSCGCGPVSKPREFVIESFATRTVDGSGNEILKTQSRNFDQISISLEIKDIKFTSHAKVGWEGLINPGFAFACSPAPDTSKNELNLIEIINEGEFTLADGTKYPIGEKITSLVGINRVFNNGVVPIAEFTGLGRKLTFEDSFKIGLLQNPGKELQLKFTIRLVFDDAQEFLLTDQILNVQ